MWFSKKSTCPPGSTHAYKYDGKLFETEKERDRYIDEQFYNRVRRDYLDVVIKEFYLSQKSIDFLDRPSNYSQKDIERVADFFFKHAWMLQNAIEAAKKKEKSTKETGGSS